MRTLKAILHSPPFSELHELRFRSCVLHFRVWSCVSWLPKCGPSRQSSILHLFSEPHECHCLAMFMSPPLSSAKPLVTGKYVLLLFSRSVPSPNMCICVCVYYSRVACCWLYFVLCCTTKKKEGVETRIVTTERAGWTKSVSYLCFPLISDER